MELLKQTQGLQGQLQVPADKSISHRSIMFGGIAEGKTTIKNFLRAEDCLSTLHAFRELGVKITDDGETITVEGQGFAGLKAPSAPINIGNSGTTIRLLLGILAGCDFSVTLYGDASLNRRPMSRVMNPLKEMGVLVNGANNSEFPPVTIHGNKALQPINYQMPIASAQVKSAILFAAMQTQGTSVITEKEISRNHTEEMIQQFGGKVEVVDKTITIEGPQHFVGQEINVPGDISSAAFFLVAGAIVPNSQLLLKNVGINPTRTGILDVLKKMGAEFSIQNEDPQNQAADLLIGSSSLKATVIEGEIIPRLIDELPIIALLATQAQGQTIIKNAEELKVKETNRIDATAEELTKMGANITPTEDGLIIHGPTKLHGATVDSRGDHRIGMMLQVAALIAEGTTNLERSEVVAVSYPDFFQDLEKLL